MKASAHQVRCAFTLVEILVVLAILAILMSIVFPVVRSSQMRAMQVREVGAGRNIMGAYLSYSSEHDGDLMPGYDKNVQSVQLQNGTTVQGEMCCRYPWRLAPYIGGQMDDIFLVNNGKKVTQSMTPDSFDYQYRASLNPALGINAYCVGGYDDGSGMGYFSTDVVKKLAGTVHPSSLIVFASARMKNGNDEVAGNFIITPPKFWRTKWAQKEYTSASQPSEYGNIAFRWEEKALCSFLDGHTAMLDEKELRDMRHWSGTAAENNNPDYTVPR